MPAEDLSLRPILFVDVDGVISLFGFSFDEDPPGTYHYIEGIIHCVGSRAGERLRRLAGHYELVWATGWEERANEHLPHLLGLGVPELPTLTFDGQAVFGTAHWKVDAIDRYAGRRPAAWIDDRLDERCRRWARARAAPTFLVETEPAAGIEERHVERLLDFAREVTPTASSPGSASGRARPSRGTPRRTRPRD